MPDNVQLNKQIVLRRGVIVTTDDAVVLKSNPDAPSSEYDYAFRIVHFKGGPDTKRPYLFLCTIEEHDSKDEGMRSLVKQYAKDEFPNPFNANLAPILISRKYDDERIQWSTI